jgi:uncharacterized protein YkwD
LIARRQRVSPECDERLENRRAAADTSFTVPASLVPRPPLRPVSLAAFAAAVTAALAVAPTPAPATAVVGGCTPGASWAADRSNLANGVIKLVNEHRASLGLRTLTVSSALMRSAVWKARHMATYRYMAHDDPAPPVARTAAERIAACGYGGGWGENIAEGFATPASVVAAWLASPGHKANIENPAYTVTGSGAAVATGGITLWAQDFGISHDSGTTSPTGAHTEAIVLRDLRLAPHRPQAGGNLSARVGALSVPSMKPLSNATVACHGVAAGNALTVVAHGFHSGVATCTWRVSSTALVSATIVVSSGSHAAAATFKTKPA